MRHLNLAALRQRYASAFRASTSDGHLAFKPKSLSRRQWLGMAATATLGTSPLLRNVSANFAGPFGFTHSLQSAVFSLGGKERWRIDTSRFAGAPALRVDERNGRIVIELRNARFPGTRLPADFTCQIRSGLMGWQINMEFSGLAFSGRAAFEPWLLGLEKLRSRVSVDRAICTLRDDTRIFLAGNGEAVFTPDWTLAFSDMTGSALTGFGEEMHTGRITVALPDRNSPSVLLSPPARRTLITLERDGQRWQMPSGIVTERQWKFEADESPFDVVRCEAGESGRGRRIYGLLMESDTDSTPLGLVPGNDVADGNGQPFRLPLRRPQLVLACKDNETYATLQSRFPTAPVWMSLGGVAMELGETAETPPFELVVENGQVTSSRCSPALFRTIVPMADAVVSPSPAMADAAVTFLPAEESGESQQVQPQPAAQQKKKSGSTGQVQMSPSPGAAQALLKDITVAVTRPEDLVRIDFEFRNLILQTNSGNRMLVRDKQAQPAYIIAHLPAQHIAEQAFFETANSNQALASNAGDPVFQQTTEEKKAGLPNNPTGEETPAAPPVGTRLAGPSRLVFRLPSSTSSLSFSLESLLEACGSYEPSVTAAAGILTQAQKNYAKVFGPNAAHPAAAASGTVRQTLNDVKGKTGAARAATLQKNVPMLRQRTEALLQSPVATQLPKLVTKKIITLQNAVAAASKTDPDRAAELLDGMAYLLDGVEATSTTGQGLFISSVSTGFLPVVNPAPAEPIDTQTSIEAPYRLIISPHALARWAHAPKTKTFNGHTELWHTRLATAGIHAVSERDNVLRSIRAVWSPDFELVVTKLPNHTEGGTDLYRDPFRMSMDARDRFELVHLTSNFTLSNWDPQPVHVNQLMLTTLGAWMNFRGDWEPPIPLSVESWQHRATMGRDHYVRMVYAGYLFPFGHRASLIKITERKFQKTPSGIIAAYLRQRMYIVIREREKVFPAEGQNNVDGVDREARQMPFRRLTVTTLMTPNLDSPSKSQISGKGQSAFWPRVGGVEFAFHFIGQDWDGNDIEFNAPAIFVDNGTASNATMMKDGSTDATVPGNYKNRENLRTINLAGQNVAFADSWAPGDTTFPTESATFGVELNTQDASSLIEKKNPPFYPTIASARVHIASVEQLVSSDAAREITYHDAYLAHGLGTDGNKGEVIANITGGVQIDFSGDTQRSGGLLNPNMNIVGLSRSLGTVGGSVDEVVNGSFDPVAFFKGILGDAKLLGGIPLTAIVGVVNDITGALDRVPRIVNQRTPTFVDTSLEWKPNLGTSKARKANGETDDDSLLNGVFVPNDPHGMTTRVNLHVPLTGEAPTFLSTTEIKNFDIVLLPALMEFLKIRFEKVALKIGSAEKLDVDVKLKKIEFAGPLSFVNELQRFIPSQGFSDPPNLEVTAKGVIAGFTLGIPTIAVGMFSLQNITLGAALELPFDGRPLNMHLDFCQRHNPFLLTVSIYGGGGFFGVVVSTSRLEVIEAALEFGGAVALNLGVASGGVFVMAGIYFKSAGDVASLEGYLRCGGALCILGLITVSMEFYMGLTYQSNGKVWGQATLKVKIEILFFSKTVSVHMERQFQGSASDPLVIDTHDETAWNNYLAAFAS